MRILVGRELACKWDFYGTLEGMAWWRGDLISRNALQDGGCIQGLGRRSRQSEVRKRKVTGLAVVQGPSAAGRERAALQTM